ncbi:RHS repeat domain-containing protein, partial [Micromonospora tulbaghiae]|uniref:RHS repeat domain-containing protein n=1 Tax=Micromonospora tulbaghiae TaxID=479978 RepID=UPI003EBC1D49
PAGNVTEISDLVSGDYQCFTTDHLSRLTEAWTPASRDCATAPTTQALGGPSRYWHSYRYDTAGNRTSLVEHATANGDRTTTYTPLPGTHRLIGTSTTDNKGTTAASYTYDDSGNTRTRPTASAGTQNLTWDAEGHQATSDDTTGTTTYIYDADGNRLIRKDPTGKTLYLPGQELRYTTSTTAKTGTRYYTHAGQTIATRTPSGLTWLSGDHQGTTQISITATTQTVATRRQTPFGQQRGTTGTWPTTMDKGFVGGTQDNTGLTHLSAREYDPFIGRFVSVDPIMDLSDPQQWNGYAYSNNSPVTLSDPTGLKSCSDDACGAGADYEDVFGNYVSVAGNNDGCGGSCGDDDWESAHDGACKRRCGTPAPRPDQEELDLLAAGLKEQYAADHHWLNMLLAPPGYDYSVYCGQGIDRASCEEDAWRIEACKTYDFCSDSYVANLQYLCGCQGLYRTEHASLVVPVAPGGRVPGGARGRGPTYENPGHHDPRGGPEPYNPKKAVLPSDAAEQFRKSVQVGNVRWTKIGSGRKAIYYRYFQHGDDVWHFSGSTNGVTNSGTPSVVEMDKIPIQIKRM